MKRWGPSPEYPRGISPSYSRLPSFSGILSSPSRYTTTARKKEKIPRNHSRDVTQSEFLRFFFLAQGEPGGFTTHFRYKHDIRPFHLATLFRNKISINQTSKIDEKSYRLIFKKTRFNERQSLICILSN